MSTSFICLRCRQHLNSRAFELWPFGLLRSRNFISLSSPNKPANDEGSVLSTARQKKDRAAQARDGNHNKQTGQGSQSPEPLESVNSMLERLFESTQRASAALPIRSRYSQTLNPRYIKVEDNSSSNSLKYDLATLQDMVDKGLHTAKILARMVTLPSFNRSAGPRTRSEEGKVLLVHNTVLRDILFKAIEERTALKKRLGTFAPADIIQIYTVCEVMQEQWWHMTIWQLLAVVAKSRHGEGLQDGKDSSAQFSESLYLLEDALQVWMVFTKTFCVRPRTSEEAASGTKRTMAPSPERNADSLSSSGQFQVFALPPRDWTGLPSLKLTKSVTHGPRPRFTAQFLHHFRRKLETPNTGSLAAAAAMTYLCFRAAEKVSIVSETLALDAEPFMNLITYIISCTSSTDAEFRHKFQRSLGKMNILPPVSDNLYREWVVSRQETRKHRFLGAAQNPRMTVKSSEVAYRLEQSEELEENEDMSTQRLEKGDRISAMSSDLRKAARESDVKFALKLWKRQVQTMSSGEVFDHSVFPDFLSTFFAVGRPDCATEAWNTMCKHGCEPGIVHWIALLEGCKQARDLVSLRSIWRRIEEAKVQTTNQAWAVYISGLLICKDWRTALQAVEELGKVWESSKIAAASAKPDAESLNEQQNIHEKDLLVPSIWPINAAISGLLRNKRHDLSNALLKWAGSRGVKPNTTTFNILLRPAIRLDAREDVRSILAKMKDNACEPDVVTFTIILDGIFRNPSSAFQTASVEAQESLVTRVFKDMDENGIKATAQTYSTILDGLLHPKYFNLPAAHAVLSRMAVQGVKPTPYIYTILITHYFSLSPPDLPAIDALWRRIELENIPVDHVFYDRMIEGYGRAGALEKMLALLRRMPSAGKKPGWIALLGALKALAEAEEWDLVRDLVRDVANEKCGLLRLGKRGWRGEEEFWDFVEALRVPAMDIPLRGGGEEDTKRFAEAVGDDQQVVIE
ncbi:hypothetical protein MMC13_007775 [Lambiella insularis]|nr:hypothetical protein [Lambiella insularis]